MAVSYYHLFICYSDRPVSVCNRVQLSECVCLCSHSYIQSPHTFLTHHYAGVELVEALHGAITEAVTQVFLDKVGMVQDVISHQRLLSSTDGRENYK